MLTLQVDEEGAMVQQGLWVQVSRHLGGQADPGCHHQLNQLGGGGGGLLLERLEGKWMIYKNCDSLSEDSRREKKNRLLYFCVIFLSSLPPLVQTGGQAQWR